MSYHSRTKGRGSALVIITITIAVMLHYQGWSSTSIFNVILVGAIVFIIVAIFYRPIIGLFGIFRRLMRRHKIKRISRSPMSVGSMSWDEFEYFVADWLKNRGYTDVQLTEHYDLGVDIVARKDGVTWGIQVKHYSGLVGINAVRQVVVALKMYGCDRAMVVTNSTFSRPAIELARSQGCLLINGSKL
ncbi:hypothetical protein B7Z28_01080 [Candidatus Saccharibacteria bacterium 32-45-3]|nr:MAG: hypothetical protein B7Z28_01080 [Candidatus Saccharibacteria bacterium 32-45-3]